MRNPVPFDTHAFVKRWVAAGFPEPRAEAHDENLAEAIGQLATKEDLRRAVELLEAKIEAIEERKEQRFALSEQKPEQRQAQTE